MNICEHRKICISLNIRFHFSVHNAFFPVSTHINAKRGAEGYDFRSLEITHLVYVIKNFFLYEESKSLFLLKPIKHLLESLAESILHVSLPSVRKTLVNICTFWTICDNFVFQSRYNLETELEANNSYTIDLFEHRMAQIIQVNIKKFVNS